MCEAHFTFAKGKYFIFKLTSYLLLPPSYLFSLVYNLLLLYNKPCML